MDAQREFGGCPKYCKQGNKKASTWSRLRWSPGIKHCFCHCSCQVLPFPLSTHRKRLQLGVGWGGGGRIAFGTRTLAHLSPAKMLQTSVLLNCVSKRDVSGIYSDGALWWPKAVRILSEVSSGEPPPFFIRRNNNSHVYLHLKQRTFQFVWRRSFGTALPIALLGALAKLLRSWPKEVVLHVDNEQKPNIFDSHGSENTRRLGQS